MSCTPSGASGYTYFWYNSKSPTVSGKNTLLWVMRGFSEGAGVLAAGDGFARRPAHPTNRQSAKMVGIDLRMIPLPFV